MVLLAFAYAVLVQGDSFQVVFEAGTRITILTSSEIQTQGRIVTLSDVDLIARGALNSLSLRRKGDYLIITMKRPAAQNNLTASVGDSIEMPIQNNKPIRISYDPVSKSYRFKQ